MNQRQPSHMVPAHHRLQVVYSQILRSENYSPAVFTGFSSLRVLTYSASISMIAQMLSQVDSVECIFGYGRTENNRQPICIVQHRKVEQAEIHRSIVLWYTAIKKIAESHSVQQKI
jgi:hypothetical protein